MKAHELVDVGLNSLCRDLRQSSSDLRVGGRFLRAGAFCADCAVGYRREEDQQEREY